MISKKRKYILQTCRSLGIKPFFNYVTNIIYMNHDISIDNVPEELDDHFKNFGKYSSEVDYTKVGYCSFCNTRIDEFGFCACIGGQPD